MFSYYWGRHKFWVQVFCHANTFSFVLYNLVSNYLQYQRIFKKEYKMRDFCFFPENRVNDYAWIVNSVGHCHIILQNQFSCMSQQHLQINQDIWNNYFKKLFYSENIPLAKMTENIVKDMQPPISFRDEKLQFRTGKVYLHLPGNCAPHTKSNYWATKFYLKTCKHSRKESNFLQLHHIHLGSWIYWSTSSIKPFASQASPKEQRIKDPGITVRHKLCKSAPWVTFYMCH